MLNLVLAFAILFVAFVIFYVTYGRDWLKAKPWTARFFAWIEPFEILVYKKSVTILWARFKMLLGVVLTALTQLGEIDITPLLPLLPDEWEAYVRVAFNCLPLAITLLGMIDEQQRNNTTQPLEVTALPAAELAKPEVAQTLAVAEQAHVEVVALAKAE